MAARPAHGQKFLQNTRVKCVFVIRREKEPETLEMSTRYFIVIDEKIDNGFNVFHANFLFKSFFRLAHSLKNLIEFYQKCFDEDTKSLHTIYILCC